MNDDDDKYVLHGPEPLQPLPNISLGKILYDQLVLNRNTHHQALVDAESGKSISYNEILIRSSQLARTLLANGHASQNSILAICSENTLEFFIPILAALYIGAVMVPLNHTYTPSELRFALNITRPRLVFASKLTYDKIKSIQKELDFVQTVLLIDDDEGAATTNDGDFCPVTVDVDHQVAFIMYSSGTTGLPKGVMLTHKNVLARYMQHLDSRYVAQDANQSNLGLLPFFHVYGLLVGLCDLGQNHQIVVLNRFDPILFLVAIEKYRIQRLWLAPPLLVFLAKTPLITDYDLSCVREIGSAAAPLDETVERILKNRLRIGSVRQGYGLTECTSGVLIMHYGQQKFGSCGKIVTYMSGKVRDPETGQSLGPYQKGELCFKGAMVMKGYFGNPEATSNAFTSNGWLLTGDLGYYDKNEDFFIVDRLKELIKYKGFQVAPAELEAVLLQHPDIEDAAVVGWTPQQYNDGEGELPVAFVVKASSSALTEIQVQNFVAERVSPQKRLRGGVRFTLSIPKTASGKILRRELKKLVNDDGTKSKL